MFAANLPRTRRRRKGNAKKKAGTPGGFRLRRNGET